MQDPLVDLRAVGHRHSSDVCAELTVDRDRRVVCADSLGAPDLTGHTRAGAGGQETHRRRGDVGRVGDVQALGRVHRGHDLIAPGDRLQRKGLGRRRRARLLRCVRSDARDVETLAAELPDEVDGISDVGRRRRVRASAAGASATRASATRASVTRASATRASATRASVTRIAGRGSCDRLEGPLFGSLAHCTSTG